VSYSVQDAIDGGLWGVKDAWKKSPKRMLMWRPRSFNTRDKFPDVLAGFVTVEEAQDLPNPEASGLIAAASQIETKGAELAEKLALGVAGLPDDMIEEIQMLESMLNAVAAGKTLEIRKSLRIESDQMTNEQGTLYVRAMGLAVDEVNAERDAKQSGHVKTGSLL
jgi:hypothetical protein